MKLYGFGPSRALRVQWALQEIGVDFEFIQVNLRKGENKAPEFLKLNPAGKVPVLVDDGFVLTESAAIVLYLAEKFPEKNLLPTNAKARAEVHRWIMFAVTELEEPLWRITRHTLIYPEDKRSTAEIELARGDFVPMAKILDAHMAGHQYICGDDFTAADCVGAYLIDWANENGLLSETPNLQAYLARMYARQNAPLRMSDAFKAVA